MKLIHRTSNQKWRQLRIRRASAILAVIGASLFAGSFIQSADAQTLLAGYDFQTTGNTVAVAPNTPTSYTSPFGTQSGTAKLYADGTHGSSTFVTTTSGNELTAFGGTAVNAGTGYSTTTTSPAALAILGGTSQDANGKSIVFTLSTTGYKNLILTFATQATGTGFNANTFSYSTDGTNFTAISGTVAPATSFATVTEDFSSITALNNAATVYIEYTFNGSSSASGNNRLDNIQFNATAVPEPATVLAGALMVGAVGWSQRRRLTGQRPSGRA